MDWDSVIHYISDEERSDEESELSAISEESDSSASTCIDAEESPLGGVRLRELPVIEMRNGVPIQTGVRTPVADKENRRYQRDLVDIERGMRKSSINPAGFRQIGK